MPNFFFVLIRILFRRMPRQTKLKSYQQLSPSSEKSINRSTSCKSKKTPRKAPFLNFQYQQKPHPRKTEPREQTTSKEKHKDNKCLRCKTLKKKLKEREQHFCQLIQLHKHEMESLTLCNIQLREQLQLLSERAQTVQVELTHLKDQISRSSLDQISHHCDELISVSPIGEAKGLPVIIKRIAKRLTEEAEASSLAQLLAVTPQESELGANPFQAGQKQNALKQQFERLMTECSQTSNRSKKATLRHQLASIANQISALQRSPAKT